MPLADARGAEVLGLVRRGLADVYAGVADRHPRFRYGARIPAEQLWQIAAYIADLPKHKPEKRRRLDQDQPAEPQGPRWAGPLQ